MAVTPQTNTTLEAIAEQLRAHDGFVICGHVSPDGDCLGSQLALANVLRLMGKRVTCLLAKDEPVGVGLSFLPGVDQMVPAQDFSQDFDVFVAVDVPTPERLGEAASSLHAKAALTIAIDHHAVDERMSDLSYTDPDAASTSLIIWEIAGVLLGEAGRTPLVATCAYVGLMTDTGRFQYQNANSAAFSAASEMVAAGADPAAASSAVYMSRTPASVRLQGVAVGRMKLICSGQVAISWICAADMEACGAQKPDAEGLVDVLRSIAGVRVACMLREQGDVVRGSLRAKDDTDVASIAREFGGGGHRAAAGLTLPGPIQEAAGVMERRLEVLFAKERG